MAADSTMLRIVNLLMALSLGVQREQFEHLIGLTWPRPFLLRPLDARFLTMIAMCGCPVRGGKFDVVVGSGRIVTSSVHFESVDFLARKVRRTSGNPRRGRSDLRPGLFTSVYLTDALRLVKVKRLTSHLPSLQASHANQCPWTVACDSLPYPSCLTQVEPNEARPRAPVRR